MLRTALPIGLLLPALLAPGTASATMPPTPTATERMCHGVVATIVGTPGNDRISGTRGDDVIVGLGGNDRIDGLAGADMICGNGGADDLTGGRGADQLFGGSDLHEQHGRRTRVYGDLLAGGPGADHLDPGQDDVEGHVQVWRRDTITYAHSRHAVMVDLAVGTATGEGDDTVAEGRLEVAGSRFDDVLTGSDRSDRLDGGRGDDQVDGGGGPDLVLSYRGSDLLQGEEGRDLVISTSGVSTVDGGDGRDALMADSPAPTTVLGGAGFDFITRGITAGETGVIDGGPGANYLELETTSLWSDRDPSFAVDAAAGTFTATADEDVQSTGFTGIAGFVLWGPGRWSFLGSEGDDSVQVLEGSLDAQGLGGDDYLIGDRRADVLDGGEGTDAGWGGGGQNTCIDTELGDCSGLPWDQRYARARVAGPVESSPRHVVRQWMNRH